MSLIREFFLKFILDEIHKFCCCAILTTGGIFITGMTIIVNFDQDYLFTYYFFKGLF